MIDYIIVGCGLAGISFVEQLLAEGKTFLVFENNSQNSSIIAGGLYNPVILKRFSEVWNAQLQLNEMDTFYSKLKLKFPNQFDYKVPIYRKFFSIEEQNNWFSASDHPNLTPFLSTEIVNRQFKTINAPYGYGEVLHTGYVDTANLLHCYRDYLKSLHLLNSDSFGYSDIKIIEDMIYYKNTIASNIVFAEGFGMHANPFFNYLPLDGTKGELFIIKAPDLDIDVIMNTSVFILPLGNHFFKVGATYNWQDKTSIPTEEGKLELIERIKELITCDFEIVEHFAGVRPTVRDRRPLVGTHPIYKNFHILNGLGTRGVMLGPSMAKSLYLHIEYKLPLDKEIDINRFTKKFFIS